MAEIVFGTNDSNNIGGSGLGFYGSTFGSSVQIGSYQNKTYVTNANGTTNGGNATNIKYGDHPGTGICERVNSGIPLVRLNGDARTFDVTFYHTTPVNVQNVQFRVYDRENINNPASGVNTKVAELVNFNNLSYSSWNSSPGADNTLSTYGSGDLFWWGEAWPANATNTNYYQNSVGVKFYNGRNGVDSVTNGDVRLQGITGGDDTVGGSGLIVPLLDSPGSGGRYLEPTLGSLGTQKFVPKWKQYYLNSYYATPGRDVPDIGTAGLYDSTYTTFGGSGLDQCHTWRVAISATPLSIGSKEKYGAYVSLEYL